MKNKKIIIINGAGVGKYKFLNKLKETEIFNVFSSVSKVKVVSKILGWDGKTLTDKDRRLISDIKDAYSKYNNGPINDIINDINKSNTNLNIVLSREKYDNDQLKKYYKNNIKIILFSRVGEDIIYHKNHADKGVYDYNYDKVMLVFDNNLDDNIKDFKKLIQDFN